MSGMTFGLLDKWLVITTTTSVFDICQQCRLPHQLINQFRPWMFQQLAHRLIWENTFPLPAPITIGFLVVVYRINSFINDSLMSCSSTWDAIFPSASLAFRLLSIPWVSVCPRPCVCVCVCTFLMKTTILQHVLGVIERTWPHQIPYLSCSTSPGNAVYRPDMTWSIRLTFSGLGFLCFVLFSFPFFFGGGLCHCSPEWIMHVQVDRFLGSF